MSDEDYRELDAFIKQAEELVFNVNGTEQDENELGGYLEALENKASKDIESSVILAEQSINNYVDILVSDDELKVTADFHAPNEGCDLLDIKKIDQWLKDKGIVYGIDWNIIEEKVKECN